MHILPEHKKKYLERRIDEIEQLNACIISNNLEVAVSIGHRLKGNGETFGYPEISAVGIALEHAAAAHDKIGLKEAVDKLQKIVKQSILEIEET